MTTSFNNLSLTNGSFFDQNSNSTPGPLPGDDSSTDSFGDSSFGSSFDSSSSSSSSLTASSINSSGSMQDILGQPSSSDPESGYQDPNQTDASSQLTNIDSTTTDPISSSMSNSGNAQAFVTSPMVNQINPIDYGSDDAYDASDVQSSDPSVLSALSGRYGTTSPTTNKGLSNLLNLSFSDAVGNEIGSVTGSAVLGKLAAAATSVATTVAVNALTGGQTPGLQSFLNATASKFSGIGNIGTFLASTYDPSYASIADSNGNAIDGIPSDTDPSVYNTLVSLMSSTCTNSQFTFPTTTSYRNNQNLANALLTMIMQSGLSGLLTQAASCNELVNSGSTNTILGQLGGLAANGASATVAAAINIVGGGLVSGASDLIKSIVGSSNPDATAPSDIQSIMVATNQTPDDIYGDGSYGDQTVWDADSLNDGDGDLTSSVVGDDVYSMSDPSDANMLS